MDDAVDVSRAAIQMASGQYTDMDPPESDPESGWGVEALAGDCASNYEGACVPFVDYALDCPDIPDPVFVVGTDFHGFDRDRDGVGCEMN